MFSEGFWMWVGRSAEFATLAALIIAIKALRDSATAERTLTELLKEAKAERGQIVAHRAALVLSVGDLLAKRLKGYWQRQFLLNYNTDPPPKSFLEWMLREAEQDLGFAKDLIDRGAQVDVRAVAYADLIYQRISVIGFLLREAFSLSTGIAAQRAWAELRLRFHVKVQETLELLALLESMFPEEATRVSGVMREAFLLETASTVGATARTKAQTLLKDAEENLRRIEEEDDDWFKHYGHGVIA